MTFQNINKLLNFYDHGNKEHNKRDYECLKTFVEDNHIVGFDDYNSSIFLRRVLHTNRYRKVVEYENSMLLHLDHYITFKCSDKSVFLTSQRYGTIEEHIHKIEPQQKDMRVEMYDGTHCWYHPDCVLVIYCLKDSPKVIVDCKRSFN